MHHIKILALLSGLFVVSSMTKPIVVTDTKPQGLTEKDTIAPLPVLKREANSGSVNVGYDAGSHKRDAEANLGFVETGSKKRANARSKRRSDKREASPTPGNGRYYGKTSKRKANPEPYVDAADGANLGPEPNAAHGHVKREAEPKPSIRVSQPNDGHPEPSRSIGDGNLKRKTDPEAEPQEPSANWHDGPGSRKRDAQGGGSYSQGANSGRGKRDAQGGGSYSQGANSGRGKRDAQDSANYHGLNTGNGKRDAQGPVVIEGQGSAKRDAQEPRVIDGATTGKRDAQGGLVPF